MSNRGIVSLNEEHIAHLLCLGKSEHVSCIWTDPITLSILIGIEGPELPEVAPGHTPPFVERSSAVIGLRHKLIEMWFEREPGGRFHGKPQEFADAVGALIQQELRLF